MNASNPLDTLIEQSRKARDHAGRNLADDRRGQAQSAAQLDALRRYRHEYCRRLQDAMSRGIDAATLANYRRFIRSLDDAIDKALQALDQQQEKVAASQQHWQQRQRQPRARPRAGPRSGRHGARPPPRQRGDACQRGPDGAPGRHGVRPDDGRAPWHAPWDGHARDDAGLAWLLPGDGEHGDGAGAEWVR